MRSSFSLQAKFSAGPRRKRGPAPGPLTLTLSVRGGPVGPDCGGFSGNCWLLEINILIHSFETGDNGLSLLRHLLHPIANRVECLLAQEHVLLKQKSLSQAASQFVWLSYESKQPFGSSGLLKNKSSPIALFPSLKMTPTL